MPVYEYYCSKCSVRESRILPISERNNLQTHGCGETMERKFSVPRTCIVKQSANQMALDSLNGDGHRNGLSPAAKGIGMEQKIMQGMERNRPRIYSGF